MNCKLVSQLTPKSPPPKKKKINKKKCLMIKVLTNSFQTLGKLNIHLIQLFYFVSVQTPMKSILFFNPFVDDQFHSSFGQQPFVDSECEFSNCFTTNNRSLLGNDLSLSLSLSLSILLSLSLFLSLSPDLTLTLNLD
jgi:hypothetical protein